MTVNSQIQRPRAGFPGAHLSTREEQQPSSFVPGNELSLIKWSVSCAAVCIALCLLSNDYSHSKRILFLVDWSLHFNLSADAGAGVVLQSQNVRGTSHDEIEVL